MARAELEVKLIDYAKIRDALKTADEAIAILRAVAACEPMAYCPGDEMSGDWYECGFCEAQADAVTRYEWGETKHHSSCQWRQAREWMAGHVVVTDPAGQPDK